MKVHITNSKSELVWNGTLAGIISINYITYPTIIIIIFLKKKYDACKSVDSEHDKNDIFCV